MIQAGDFLKVGFLTLILRTSLQVLFTLYLQLNVKFAFLRLVLSFVIFSFISETRQLCRSLC